MSSLTLLITSNQTDAGLVVEIWRRESDSQIAIVLQRDGERLVQFHAMPRDAWITMADMTEALRSADAELDAYYTSVAARLGDLMATIEMPVDETVLVGQLIEIGKLETALMQLCEFLKRTEVDLSISTLRELYSLCVVLEIDNEHWDRFAHELVERDQ